MASPPLENVLEKIQSDPASVKRMEAGGIGADALAEINTPQARAALDQLLPETQETFANGLREAQQAQTASMTIGKDPAATPESQQDDKQDQNKQQRQNQPQNQPKQEDPLVALIKLLIKVIKAILKLLLALLMSKNKADVRAAFAGFAKDSLDINNYARVQGGLPAKAYQSIRESLDKFARGQVEEQQAKGNLTDDEANQAKQDISNSLDPAVAQAQAEAEAEAEAEAAQVAEVVPKPEVEADADAEVEADADADAEVEADAAPAPAPAPKVDDAMSQSQRQREEGSVAKTQALSLQMKEEASNFAEPEAQQEAKSSGFEKGRRALTEEELNQSADKTREEGLPRGPGTP